MKTLLVGDQALPVPYQYAEPTLFPDAYQAPLGSDVNPSSVFADNPDLTQGVFDLITTISNMIDAPTPLGVSGLLLWVAVRMIQGKPIFRSAQNKLPL